MLEADGSNRSFDWLGPAGQQTPNRLKQSPTHIQEELLACVLFVQQQGSEADAG